MQGPDVFQAGPQSSAAEGYNSEDEYSHLGVSLSEEEWLEKDRRFERALKKKGETDANVASVFVVLISTVASHV